MDASLRLRSVQHDKLEIANLTPLSLSLQKERDVCASRQGEVNPASGCFAPLSMTRAKMSFRTPVRNPVRCGCFTSLRFVQQDKLEMANLTLLSLALQKERDVCASRQGEVAFRARQESSAWMLHCAMLRSA